MHVNPTGRFVTGGPMGDAGLTGRKIIVDSYGGMARHGGGAFSGKDPTKVDRSAAYAARWVAKNVVAAGLADRFEVELAYGIGIARPISFSVESFGTGRIDDADIQRLIERHFDLRPAAIIAALDLRRPIYRQTAAYGHFGRPDLDLPWERTDKAALLASEAGRRPAGARPRRMSGTRRDGARRSSPSSTAVESFDRRLRAIDDRSLEAFWAWEAYDEEGRPVRDPAHDRGGRRRRGRDRRPPGRDRRRRRAGRSGSSAAISSRGASCGRSPTGPTPPLDTPPLEGEWPLRTILDHLIEADLGFLVTIRNGLEQLPGRRRRAAAHRVRRGMARPGRGRREAVAGGHRRLARRHPAFHRAARDRIVARLAGDDRRRAR